LAEAHGAKGKENLPGKKKRFGLKRGLSRMSRRQTIRGEDKKKFSASIQEKEPKEESE